MEKNKTEKKINVKELPRYAHRDPTLNIRFFKI